MDQDDSQFLLAGQLILRIYTDMNRDNQIHYFEIGKGKWAGEFAFSMTDWRAFWKDSIGIKNRFMVLLMLGLQRVFGHFKIEAHTIIHPHRGASGVANHVVRVRKIGLTLYLLKQECILDVDGINVNVRSRERFGFFPLFFRQTRQHPVAIHKGGMGATYEIPLLGTRWHGNYDFRAGGDQVCVALKCGWAEVTENIRRSLIDTPDAGENSAVVLRNGSHIDRVRFVAERLEDYVKWYEANRDSRAVFTFAYATITRIIADKFDRANFNDPEWVVALDEAFAAHYFQALDTFDLNQNMSGGWKTVFDAICFKNTSVLEDLVFAITSHIVQDLPLALVDAGLNAKNGSSHIRDFHKVNDILAEDINIIQDKVSRRYNPYLRWLDYFAKDYDEILTNYGFRVSRGLAWYNASRLLDPLSHVEASASIQRSTGAFINEVLNPPIISVRIITRFARYIAGKCRRWPNA